MAAWRNSQRSVQEKNIKPWWEQRPEVEEEVVVVVKSPDLKVQALGSSRKPGSFMIG